MHMCKLKSPHTNWTALYCSLMISEPKDKLKIKAPWNFTTFNVMHFSLDLLFAPSAKSVPLRFIVNHFLLCRYFPRFTSSEKYNIIINIEYSNITHKHIYIKKRKIILLFIFNSFQIIICSSFKHYEYMYYNFYIFHDILNYYFLAHNKL